MKVQFVASVAPIVRDAEATRAFYTDALGLSLEGGDGEYAFTEKLGGTKHFGLWPPAKAPPACFATTEWPSEIPVPEATIALEQKAVVRRDEGVGRHHRVGVVDGPVLAREGDPPRALAQPVLELGPYLA